MSTEAEKTSNLRTGLLLFVNYLSSVALVFLNKAVFQVYHWNYPTLLSTVHFVVGSLGFVACALVGIFEIKKVPYFDLLWIAVLYALNIPFCNASLRFNSVGFHQIGKAMTIPVAVIVEYFFYNKPLPNWNIFLTLAAVSFGVGVTGLTDIGTTLLGITFITLCVFSTVVSQIKACQVQNVHSINSMQLLFYVLPLATPIQVAFAPIIDHVDVSDFFEGENSPWNFPYTLEAVLTILLSGIASFFLNYSGFAVLGLTSPVTYQVFGHFKTTSILIGGFFLFSQPLILSNVFGILLCLCGTFTYSYIKMAPQQVKEQPQKEPTPPKQVELEIKQTEPDLEKGVPPSPK